MNQKNSFYPVTKYKPKVISFTFNHLPSQKACLSSQEKKAFELVLYGLNVIDTTMQVALLSLHIIAMHQIFWKQIVSQGNIKNGDVLVLNKHFHSTISFNAGRIRHLLSQI